MNNEENNSNLLEKLQLDDGKTSDDKSIKSII